jgi:hypothetical protein
MALSPYISPRHLTFRQGTLHCAGGVGNGLGHFALGQGSWQRPREVDNGVGNFATGQGTLLCAGELCNGPGELTMAWITLQRPRGVDIALEKVTTPWRSLHRLRDTQRLLLRLVPLFSLLVKQPPSLLYMGPRLPQGVCDPLISVTTYEFGSDRLNPAGSRLSLSVWKATVWRVRPYTVDGGRSAGCPLFENLLGTAATVSKAAAVPTTEGRLPGRGRFGARGVRRPGRFARARRRDPSGGVPPRRPFL